MTLLSRSLIGLFCLTVLSGCVRTNPSSPPTGGTIPVIPTASPLPVLPTAEPTPIPCLESAGVITTVELPSPGSKQPLAVKIYTPPCFDLANEERFPLLILIHGQSATYDNWIDAGVPKTLDAMYAGDKSSAMIVAFPQEANSQIDPDESDFETQITEVLIPWMGAHYPLLEEPRSIAVGGLSRGAGWAFRLGLDHPYLFVSVGAHSPAIDGNDYFKLADFRREYKNNEIPRIYLDIGFQDGLKDSARKVELRLGELSIPHEWHMNPGSHNLDYWSSQVEDYLKWYADGWE